MIALRAANLTWLRQARSFLAAKMAPGRGIEMAGAAYRGSRNERYHSRREAERGIEWCWERDRMRLTSRDLFF